MPTVRVRVPATSANLGPGFDTLGLAFKIYNFVTIREADVEHSSISVTGAGADTLPRDERNIALAAARQLLQHLDAPDVELQLSLENSIPLARGLGSSSAARVGALVAANEWVKRSGGQGAAPDVLLALAAQLEGHPDNAAAALLGGLVVSTIAANGNLQHQPPRSTAHNALANVVAVRLPVTEFPRFVIFIPEGELSTTAARAVLPDAVFRADANFNLARTGLLLAALATGQWDVLREALHDRLHQEHRAVLVPGLQSILRAALEAGAYGATLSGAGPSVLAWLPHDEVVVQETRQAVQDAAAEHEVFGQALEVEVDLAGSVVLSDDESR